MKEIKENINKWIDNPCSYTDRLKSIKMSFLPTWSIDWAESSKVLASHFVDSAIGFQGLYEKAKDPE